MTAKTNYSLVIMLTIAATLGGLLFGYDTAVISGATKAITFNFVAPRPLPEAAANTLSGFAIDILSDQLGMQSCPIQRACSLGPESRL